MRGRAAEPMKSRTKSHLTGDQVRRLAAKHFPGAEVAKVRELTGGMFNAAYLLTGTGALERGVVLKTGPRPDAEILTYEKDILRAEVEVYQLVEGRVPTPRLLAADFSREIAPGDCFFMEKMDGTTWKRAAKKIPAAAKPDLMRALGRANAGVHSVEGAWFGYLKGDARFRFDSWSGAFSGMMNDILDDGRRRGYDLPYDEIAEAVAANRARLDAVQRPRLVDFDLWAGNVFLSNEGGWKLAGVVDFERAFYGDPFADFTSAFYLFEDVEREPDFRAGYEEASGRPLIVTEDDRVRMELYRLYMAAILVVEAYRYNRPYRLVIQRHFGGRIRKMTAKLKNA